MESVWSNHPLDDIKTWDRWTTVYKVKGLMTAIEGVMDDLRNLVIHRYGKQGLAWNITADMFDDGKLTEFVKRRYAIGQEFKLSDQSIDREMKFIVDSENLAEDMDNYLVSLVEKYGL